MAAATHPQTTLTTVNCASSGSAFQLRSTREQLTVDVCSNCHPFYTGKQTIVDTAGQVERFQRRLERSTRS